jgi:3-oxoacyl-[acyl-carrier-protein] synthase II
LSNFFLSTHCPCVRSQGKGSGLLDIDKVTEGGRLPPFIAYALEAAEEALCDAGWRPSTDAERLRTGVAIGSGMGHLPDIIKAGQLVHAGKGRRVSPFFIPNSLINLAAGHVSMRHGLMGPSHAASTACASGAHSIGDAFKMIRFGEADVMLAGAFSYHFFPHAHSPHRTNEPRFTRLHRRIVALVPHVLRSCM